MREYPAELTPELAEVLGLLNFQTCPLAHLFRDSGKPIPARAQAEQAFVLHWLIGLVLEHGPAWRKFASVEIDRMNAERKPCPATN